MSELKYESQDIAIHLESLYESDFYWFSLIKEYSKIECIDSNNIDFLELSSRIIVNIEFKQKEVDILFDCIFDEMIEKTTSDDYMNENHIVVTDEIESHFLKITDNLNEHKFEYTKLFLKDMYKSINSKKKHDFYKFSSLKSYRCLDDFLDSINLSFDDLFENSIKKVGKVKIKNYDRLSLENKDEPFILLSIQDDCYIMICFSTLMQNKNFDMDSFIVREVFY